MGASESKCTSQKRIRPRPKLGGKKARFVCSRCGMKARKKDELCKPRKD